MSVDTEPGLKWPSRCEMPDLSGLPSKTSLDVALNRMFCGAGPRDRVSYALLMNYNRVVDLLVEDYEAARRSMLEATQSTGDVPLHALLSAIGHLENCVTTTLRAMRFAQRLRNKSRGVIVPPKLAVLSGAVERRVRDIRNAIEHLDSQLASGNWQASDPLCLMVYEDRLELAGYHIRYGELAQWITELHDLAVSTAQFKEP